MDKEKSSKSLPLTIQKLKAQIEEKEQYVQRLLLANQQHKIAEANFKLLNTTLAQKVVKRTAQYAFISQINQAIVQAKDAKTLFRNSCHIALEFGQFKMAWIGHFDNRRKKITLLDSEGIPKVDIKRFTTTYQRNGVQDQVLQTGKYYLCNDVQQDLISEIWKPYAAKQGISSLIVLPIRKSGKIFGTFNLYAAELHFFDEEDIKLVTEVASDISFALDLFEKQKRHKMVEALILKNEKRFRSLIENSADMITLSNREGKLLYASSNVTKLFGYDTEEVPKAVVKDFIHPDDLPEFSQKRAWLLQSPGQSFTTQLRIKHKNGKWIWCETTITNLLEKDDINALLSNFRDISEKKATEKQLEFEKNNLNALINNTNDLMWSVDTDFRLITSNKPFEKLIKLNAGKDIAKGTCMLTLPFPKEQIIRHKRHYERAFSGETFTVIDHGLIPEEHWLSISYYPIVKGNQVIGTACHSRDITQVKKAEQQLIKNEAFNRGILDSLISNIAVIENSGKIVAVNESWKRFAAENGDTNLLHTAEGINYFEVCRKSALEGNELAGEVLQGMLAILEDRENDFYYEYPCNSPTESRWFAMRAIKFKSNVPMIVVAHTDISERKFAEKNLVQSEARLKEALALSHISNWEVCLESGVHSWSEEFYNLCGYSLGEVPPSAEAFLSLVHPDDRKITKAILQNTNTTFEAGSFNARIIKPNGAIRYIYSQWKFEFDQKQKPVRIFGILQDVTERKLAEQEREKLSADLIQRNLDLEQFTYIISHNLRAPTANIIGYTENLLDEENTAAEQQQLLNGLSTSVGGLDAIIKDINAILAIKSDFYEKRELISLSKLVKDVANSIENTIAKHQVEIKADFSEVDKVLSLKGYLHSIFYNLISNSIKYGKPNVRPIIKIKSKKEGNKITILFQDNGLGIDMKINGDKIFGLYKRFHSHTEGKGLGLFMVKTQVEAIGGKISVDSKPNHGTEFTIVFEKQTPL